MKLDYIYENENRIGKGLVTIKNEKNWIYSVLKAWCELIHQIWHMK